ncbi:uncharacterized [Tachysurus ichikawai]
MPSSRPSYPLSFPSLWLTFFHYDSSYSFLAGLSVLSVKGPEKGGEDSSALPSRCETKPNMLIKGGRSKRLLE